MESKIERIKSWLNGNKAGPWKMQVQPTDRCNLKCRFCWRNSYSRQEEELSKKKWLNIIKESCDAGMKMITIVGGGEPLVRPEVTMAIAKEIKKHNVDGTIVTNGTLFTESVVKDLIKIGWDGISFSINGTKKNDDFLRGVSGAFDRSIKSVKLINHWKKKLQSEKPVLTFHIVITKYNYNEIVDMVNLANQLDVKIVLFKLVNEGGDSGIKKLSIKKEQIPILKSQLDKAKEIAKLHDIELKQEFDIESVIDKDNESEDSDEVFSIPCVKPFSEIVILADGTTHPCCVICESKYKNDFKDKNYLDNISNKSFKELWGGEKFNNLRKAIIENKLPEECSFYCTKDMVFRQKSGVIYADEW